MVHPQEEEKITDLNDFNVEIEQLKTWLQHHEKLKGICLLTHLGTLPIFYDLDALDKSFKLSWIVDSWATSYMIDTSKFFNVYALCPNNKKIVIIGGLLTTIVGIGNIKLNPYSTHIDVLQVYNYAQISYQ